MRNFSLIRFGSTIAAALTVLGIATVCLADGAPPATRAASRNVPAVAPTQGAEPVVNVNTATADELTRLPGVGPTRAEAILALRTRMGRFARIEDLLRVRGIGRATLRKMRASVSLDGPTTLVQSRARRSNVPPSADGDEEP